MYYQEIKRPVRGRESATKRKIEDCEKEIDSLEKTRDEIDAKKEFLEDISRDISRRIGNVSTAKHVYETTKSWNFVIDHSEFSEIEKAYNALSKSMENTSEYDFSKEEVQQVWDFAQELGLQVFRFKATLKRLMLNTASETKEWVSV